MKQAGSRFIISPFFVTSTLVSIWLLSVGQSSTAAGEDFQGKFADSDCHALKLKSAAGVPDGKVRKYSFSGTCNINLMLNGKPNVQATLPAAGNGQWDTVSKEFTETFHITKAWYTAAHVTHDGSTYNFDINITTGAVASKFKCQDDPLLTYSPCLTLTHSNNSGFLPFSNPAKHQRPLLLGKTSQAEAAAMSQTGGSTGLSPTAAKAASSLTQAMMLNVEGEDLVKNGKFQVAGGQVTSQPMSGFGSGWSGAGQLFWTGGSVGAVLDLLIDVPVAATYALEIYPTRAPDYGQFKVQVAGKYAVGVVDAYTPHVRQPGPRQIGKFSLQKGVNQISLMISGKNAQSSGYYVGIDRIRLYPTGNP